MYAERVDLMYSNPVTSLPIDEAHVDQVWHRGKTV